MRVAHCQDLESRISLMASDHDGHNYHEHSSNQLFLPPPLRRNHDYANMEFTGNALVVGGGMHSILRGSFQYSRINVLTDCLA